MSLAGTSAGAINTIALACLGTPSEAVYNKLKSIVGEKKLLDLVDGGWAMKALTSIMVKKWVPKFLLYPIFFLSIFIRLLFWKGLNPGMEFLKWMKTTLAKEKVETTNQMLDKRNKVDGIKYEPFEFPEEYKESLLKEKEASKFVNEVVVIASEITTNSKVEFHKDKDLFFENPENVNPAEYVRASMSIPFFFHPYKLSMDWVDRSNAEEVAMNWKEKLSYTGSIEDVMFVDGGMLSNFPIDQFHNPDLKTAPRKPTFGARLSTYRDKPNEVGSLLKMSGAMISTMRQIHDYDFLLQNKDYKHVICLISADKHKDRFGNEFNWLDFNMPDETKIDLFFLGAVQAVNFLHNFNWKGYRDGRVKGEFPPLSKEKVLSYDELLKLAKK